MPKPQIINMTDQEIRQHFTQNLTVRDVEKDKFGEVFTPPELIDELLDNLPAHVWSDPEGRWLDPAAGKGNFMAFVYIRLLKSLAKKIPNVQERKTHILSKMLFMVELNSQSAKLIKDLFYQSGDNLLVGDFLDITAILEPGFSVILGNPPFQTDKEGETYEGGAGNRTLWDKFLTVALSGQLLRPDGYLAFITPAGWRRPESPLYDLVTKQNRLLFLHIYSKSDGQDKFAVQTRFDSYIVQKQTNSSTKSDTLNKSCKIIDEEGKTHTNINPRKWPFLPNFAFDKIRRIMVDTSKSNNINNLTNDNAGIPILFNSSEYDARKLSKRKTIRNRYPVVHGITQKGLGIQFAKVRDTKQFGVPKVLLNFNERQYPYNDFAGKYGMSQLTFGIPIRSKREGDQWIKAISSPEFEEILRATKWGAFQTDYRMFRYFDPNFYKRSNFREKTRKVRK